MSGKFTPGPWTANEDDATDWLVTAPDAECPDSPWNIAVVVGACGYPGDPRTGSTEANARLIASAPAMHAALEGVEWLILNLSDSPISLASRLAEGLPAIQAALALSRPMEERS